MCAQLAMNKMGGMMEGMGGGEKPGFAEVLKKGQQNYIKNNNLQSGPQYSAGTGGAGIPGALPQQQITIPPGYEGYYANPLMKELSRRS